MIHSFPFYILDWRDSGARMKLNNNGKLVYLELFIYCWKDGFLPADEAALCKISGVSARQFAEAWPVVQEQFFQEDGVWKHWKVEQGRPKLEAWRDARKEAGRKGGKAKAKNVAIAKVLPETVSYPSSSSSSSSTSTTPPTPSVAEPPHTQDDFGGWPESDLPDRWQEMIAQAASGWPTPSGIERGKALMREAVMSAADKPGTLAMLMLHIPGQAAYYRRQKFTKSLANVMRDGDWMHPAPTDPQEDF